MTLPIERARSRRPVTWLTLGGVLLLPVLIGGILIGALYSPTERLDAMNTAVVNNDEPVTIDDQYIPLGRQLTAGLVEGSDDLDSNLTWTISNSDDAAAGLVDGTYDAVITIPENFSAAATSTAPGGTPERATIEVTTSPDSLIVDDAITAQVTQTAASVMGEELSETYLENVFLGFTTLGDQLGDAADGAVALADGAGQAADGARTWADGAATASDGAVALSDGVAQVGSGAAELSTGADGVASGADGVASGAAQLASGSTAAAEGLGEWAAGARDIAGGTESLAAGLQRIRDEVAQIPAIPQEVVNGAQQLADNSEQVNTAVSSAVEQLQVAAAQCADAGGSEELCATLANASAQASEALPTVSSAIDQSDALAAQVSQLAQAGPQLTAALDASAQGATDLAAGMNELADGAADAAAGSRGLASGAGELSSGASALADGAGQLADGASALAAGAGEAASGASDLAAGVDELATGAGTIADGVDELSDGAGTLGDGLTQAADSLPSYTDEEATDLASIVADPVGAEGAGNELFGASAVPLLTAVALWFGALATFVALQAVPRTALSSRRSSVMLALQSFAPAAAIGALQGVLVAIVVQWASNYEFGTWLGFAGLAALIGVAFAAVHQALVAVLGGIGRWVAALVGALAIATGIVSTVPGVFMSASALTPTTPAYQALLASLTTAGGMGAAVVGLVVWLLLAFGVTVLAVARRRSTTATAILAPTPA